MLPEENKANNNKSNKDKKIINLNKIKFLKYGGNKSFYLQNCGRDKQAMSYDDILELIEKAQAGDKKAEEMAISQNMGLAHYMSKKLSFVAEYDDCFQLAMIGLMNAVRNFDESKNLMFSTFACKCIANSIFHEYNYYLKDMSSFSKSIDEERYYDNGDSYTELELLAVNDAPVCDQVEKICVMEEVKKAISTQLKSKEIYILNCRYMQEQELSQRAIGKQVGVAKQYISKVELEAIGKLKDYFGKSEAE